MFSSIYNEIVAHHCDEYTPVKLSSYISYKARNCNECTNNINGTCNSDKYENIKSSVKNN